MDARTRALPEAPILPTLLRLGAPNELVMLAQAGVGLTSLQILAISPGIAAVCA
ncbi:MAG: hypothetical protein ACRC2B_24250 [Rubrivivax sp.]